jgi:hypothetical protein
MRIKLPFTKIALDALYRRIRPGTEVRLVGSRPPTTPARAALAARPPPPPQHFFKMAKAAGLLLLLLLVQGTRVCRTSVLFHGRSAYGQEPGNAVTCLGLQEMQHGPVQHRRMAQHDHGCGGR